ncbi:uncharacterized protein LOC139922408 [Centroberyx gerrardi]
MSKIEMLREFVSRRLVAAAEEICGVFERTIAEYEEEATRSKQEIDHQRKVLDIILKERLHGADPTCQPNVSYKQLQTQQEEAEGVKCSVPPTVPASACVKSECHPPQTSLLHRTQTMDYTASSDQRESDGDGSGASEATSDHQAFSPCCSIAENEENSRSVCFQESAGAQSSFMTQTLPLCTEVEVYLCGTCGKEIEQRTDEREKPYSCRGCSEVLNQTTAPLREPFTEESGAGDTSVQTGEKRACNADNWKSNKRKRLRSLGQSYVNSKNVLVPGRRLKEKNCLSCRFKCSVNIPESEREKIFAHFWGMGDSAKQKSFIIDHVLKRDKRRQTTDGDSRRQNSLEYFLSLEGRQIRVCKDFFLKTLDVSGKFARTACVSREQHKNIN